MKFQPKSSIGMGIIYKKFMEDKYMSELKEIREIVLVNIKEVVRQNKEKVEDAYKRVMRLAHLAHREGLLALDYEAEFIPKETLPYLDEETTGLVRNYMNDYRYYVIMNEPRIVTKQELEELNKELEKVIVRKGKVKGILDDIEKCTDEEIQLLLRHIDTLTLSVALKGARKETAECFYRNLSVRLRGWIQEDMEYMGTVRMCDVEESESKIIGVARNVLNWEEVLQR